MKKYFYILILLLFIAISCSKELSPAIPNENATDYSYEITELKEEIKALKEETKVLQYEADFFKQQLSEITEKEEKDDDTFEVDGLLFNRNGDLISLVKKDPSTDNGEFTVTRTYDEKGRLIEILTDYHSKSEFSGNPFYWQKYLYTYNGKEVTTTIQTSKFGLRAGQRYEETTSVSTYW